MIAVRWLALAWVGMLAACAEESKPGDTSGTEAGPYTENDGFPELTGALAIAPSEVAPGGSLRVQVPVDSDTRWVRLQVEDFPTSDVLVQDFDGPGGPSATVEVEVRIPSDTVALAGTYYLSVELCSTDGCMSPYRKVFYEREEEEGGRSGYTRTDYQAPPLTEVVAPHDSEVAITTFELL
jgi:hypothetical protein